MAQASFSDILFAPDAMGQDSAQLWAALESFKTGIEELLREFEQTLEQQPPELVEACAGEIDTVFTSGALCMHLATRLLDSLEPSGLAQLAQHRQQLDSALLAFRECALTALGPTTIPGVNLILHTAERVARGAPEQATLRELIQREQSRIDWGLANPQLDGSRKRCLLDLQDALKRLDADPRQGQLVVNAAQAWEQLAQDEPAPTGTWIDQLREAGGVLDDREYQAALEANRAEFAHAREQMDAIVAAPGASALLAGAVRRVQENLRQLEELLVQAASEDVWDQIQQVWNALNDSSAALARQAEQEGRVPCPRCGHLNATESRHCGQCAAVLPAVAHQGAGSLDMQEATGSWPQPTENLQRLSLAVEAYHLRELDREPYLAELEWMRGLVVKARLTLPPDKERPDYVEAYLEGLDEMEAGLKSLSEVEDPGDESSLMQAIQQVAMGAARVQSSVRAAAGGA